MTISYNWLKQYVDTTLSASEIASILTSIGLEVESAEPYQSIKGGLEGFVIGEVLTCAKHPDADKLSITTVNVGGSQPLNVVCGAPNVAAGQKVVVAVEGTIVYHGDESFKIKKSKIRGQVSEGMICAEDEIGLGTSHDGIMVLDASATVGTPAKSYFNIEDDVIFEIGLTPNRIDAGSHYGVARDLHAYLQSHNMPSKLSKPSVDHFKVDNNNRHIPVEVANTEACPRYMGITISGVTIGPSPEWLQNRIKAIGQRPINNVVDITNFILHELGQPLHSFDADMIKGGKVVVRTCPEGTKFVTLDEQERTLTSTDLMICNAEEAMCMGGVFGGLHSGVSDSTKNIFLESAHFNPAWIRRTAKRHGLSTDSSFLFERGTDPNMPVYALKRAAVLIKELAGGTISSEIVDVYPSPVKPFEVEVSFTRINNLIGKEIPKDVVKRILLSLEIEILREEEDTLKLAVPPYRVDVQREADVIEDILRIYGYNNVEYSEKVNSSLSFTPKPDKERVLNTIADMLVSQGFNEIMSNSLTKAIYYEGLNNYKPENLVRMLNPLSADLGVMRQTLLFGGLEAVIFNSNRQTKDLKMFELGNCYSFQPKPESTDRLNDFSEGLHLALFMTGLDSEPNWMVKEEKLSFFHIKKQVELVLRRLGFAIEAMTFTEKENELFGLCIEVSLGKHRLVEFGMVAQQILKQFDIKTEVLYADFDLNKILPLLKNQRITFKELPRFPEVRRDLALVLDKNIKFEQVRKVALQAEKKLIKRINLFDVYEGEKVGNDKKSYAVSFILQDEEQTLNDARIEKTMNNLLAAFTKELGATLR